MKKLIYPSFIIIAACLWGASGLFVRWFGELGFSTYEVVFLRLLTAAITISLAFLMFNRKAFKINIKDIWCFIGTGSIGVLGTSVFYFTTMASASLSVACVLMYTSPMFIIILSRIFFKENITLVKIISVIVIILGCFLCSYTKSGFVITLPTLITGILSGLSYGSYSIFSRFAINKGYKIDTILLYTFIFAWLGSCLFVPYESLKVNILSSAIFVVPSLGVGVLAGVAPYGLYTLGLKKVSNSKAGILAAIELVAALMVGLIAYKEIPSIYNIIGIILVFTAIAIQEINFNKKIMGNNNE
ncbi:MAG: EamA family transporter [Clostridia bacterium]|nr:EamA family transporter [Clostridia bacterium]